MAENNVSEIILDLKRSFLDDKRELQDKIVEIETEIKQAKDFIESLNKKDECDFNIFSPRSASKVYSEQVYDKKIEIEEAEEKLRSLYRKLSNVTKKIDSLNELNPDSFEEKKEEEKIVSGDSSLFLQLQEDDRQRIAADLHDSVLQNLSLVLHNLELSEKFIDYDTVRAKLEIESNRKLVKDVIDEIRSTIFDLRPMQFDDFGFKKTLENQLEGYKSRTNISISYCIDDLSRKDNLVLLTVFRIVQELVSNSIKHSNGSEIEVKVLDAGSNIYIEESDNGIGFSNFDLEKENHFGIKILKERIGSLKGTYHFVTVEKGTKIVIEIP